jgi:hypothetical protein
MPLYPGSAAYVGLGPCCSKRATVAVELPMLFAAANTPGSPPPSVSSIIVAGFLSRLFVRWAGWIDRHRETGSPA